jgi:hypothetical protein
MSPHQRFKRRLFTAAQEALQQLAIRQSRRVLLKRDTAKVLKQGSHRRSRHEADSKGRRHIPITIAPAERGASIVFRNSREII